MTAGVHGAKEFTLTWAGGWRPRGGWRRGCGGRADDSEFMPTKRPGPPVSHSAREQPAVRFIDETWS